MNHVSVPLANTAICALVVFGIVTLYPLAGAGSWLFLLVLAGLMSVNSKEAR